MLPLPGVTAAWVPPPGWDSAWERRRFALLQHGKKKIILLFPETRSFPNNMYFLQLQILAVEKPPLMAPAPAPNLTDPLPSSRLSSPVPVSPPKSTAVTFPL